MRLSLLALCGATMLGACTEVSVTHNYMPQMGVPGHADYAATQGLTPVVLANSPFAPPAVLAALQRNNPRPIIFTSDPPANDARGYRVLVAFGGLPQNGGGLNVCREPLQPGAPEQSSGAQTSVYGAFCLGPRLLSEAVVSSRRIQSPTDPRLGRLMGDLLSALMPYRDPYGENRSLCVQNCS